MKKIIPVIFFAGMFYACGSNNGTQENASMVSENVQVEDDTDDITVLEAEADSLNKKAKQLNKEIDNIINEL